MTECRTLMIDDFTAETPSTPRELGLTPLHLCDLCG
jgi:hypothetical protein